MTKVQYLVHTLTKEYATKELKVGQIISRKSDTNTPFIEGGAIIYYNKRKVMETRGRGANAINNQRFRFLHSAN